MQILKNLEKIYSKLTMIPLKITAKIRGPIMIQDWIPFDGLLMAIQCNICDIPPLTLDDSERFDVPIPIQRCPETSIYKASFGVGKALKGSYDAYPFRKRFPLLAATEIGNDKIRKILIASGAYKNHNIPYRTKIVPEITWYCVGHQESIEELLVHCFYLGKKRNVGFGSVEKWIVEPHNEDFSWWLPSPNLGFARPARSLPFHHPEVQQIINTGKSVSVGYLTPNPPYWDRTLATSCVVPEPIL